MQNYAPLNEPASWACETKKWASDKYLPVCSAVSAPPRRNDGGLSPINLNKTLFTFTRCSSFDLCVSCQCLASISCVRMLERTAHEYKRSSAHSHNRNKFQYQIQTTLFEQPTARQLLTAVNFICSDFDKAKLSERKNNYKPSAARRTSRSWKTPNSANTFPDKRQKMRECGKIPLNAVHLVQRAIKLERGATRSRKEENPFQMLVSPELEK